MIKKLVVLLQDFLAQLMKKNVIKKNVWKVGEIKEKSKSARLPNINLSINLPTSPTTPKIILSPRIAAMVSSRTPNENTNNNEKDNN